MSKRIIFIVVLALMLIFVSGICFATPITNFKEEEVIAGIGSVNWDSKYTYGRRGDFSSERTMNLQYGVSDKFALSAELGDTGNIHLHYTGGGEGDYRMKDLTVRVHYKLSDEVQLLAGNLGRHARLSYGDGSIDSASNNKFLYGIGATLPLQESLRTFASWEKAGYISNYQVGISYQFSSQISAYVAYNSETYNGIKNTGTELGARYTF